jgi:Zn/Cd-binding protein ZinT
MPALYLVHCGYCDHQLGGVYESHVNFFIAAESFEDARVKAKRLDEFQSKRMHIDGMQQIASVQGYLVNLTLDPVMDQKSSIIGRTHRELSQGRSNFAE